MSPAIRRYPFLDNYKRQYFDARHVVKLLVYTPFFFKKSTLFDKYRMLPKFSRLGAGSVVDELLHLDELLHYVDELIQFF